MIVPDHWAEARRQQKTPRGQVTVRRHGWSSTSLAEAQSMAQARADEALQRILAGEKNLARREPKVPYNGSQGVPIREEVLARHGEDAITRNAYGAHCLNTAHALFADIDFDSGAVGCRSVMLAFAGLAAASVAAGVALQNKGVAFCLLVASLLLAMPLATAWARWRVRAKGGPERMARQRIAAFIAAHPAWNLRLYRTPAGYRLLATHQPFEPRSDEVRDFFAAVAADPLYVRMCVNQNCFRARLTGKPWRMGLRAHMRPRPGVWPVRPEMAAVREASVANYEARAAGFAACRYVESLGSGAVHASLQAVVDLHDRESRALVDGAPLA